jgi:hypothetical protein
MKIAVAMFAAGGIILNLVGADQAMNVWYLKSTPALPSWVSLAGWVLFLGGTASVIGIGASRMIREYNADHTGFIRK